MKIDFVLPWVDGNDLEWQETKNKYTPSSTDSHNTTIGSGYRDLDTLKYVLRSIEQNCPWYNKIHLITCGHYPEWLDISHPKINLITHDELFFNKSHLPVFSSRAIEMNLANLQGTSEHIVYLNDDMIIINGVAKNRFFDDGKPIDFLSHGWIPRNKVFEKTKGMSSWEHSLNNNLNLLNNKFSPLAVGEEYLYHPTYGLKVKLSNFLLNNLYKKFFWIEHWHHPQPYLLQTFRDVYNEFQDEITTSSSSKFRTKNNLTPYLYRYWQLVKQDFIPRKYNDGLARNINSVKQLKNIFTELKNNPDINFVCFNDSFKLKDSEFNKVKILMGKFLKDKFSKPASFENIS